MPHPDEQNVINDLEDWNIQAANEYRNCINYAKNWRASTQLQDGTGDAFSNVLNNSGCNANLTAWLSSNKSLLERAQICLQHYKDKS